MKQELYLLQDGTYADPSEVSRGKDGVLRHKNGLAVCLYENGEPQTVQEDSVRNKNVEAAKIGPAVDAIPQSRVPVREPAKPGEIHAPVGPSTHASPVLLANPHNTIGPGHTEKLD